MNTISSQKEALNAMARIITVKCSVVKYFCAMVVLLLVACDMQGPWSYLPEERELYRGIYTYAWIESGDVPHLCFNKLYKLTEAAAEDFAFYDSAHVTVTGKFENAGETELVLSPKAKDENCFEPSENAYGIKGESYEMKATFKWDSAGTVVVSTYTAVAHIPENFGVKGTAVPLPLKQSLWVPFSEDTLKTKFLEFPFDMDPYKFAMDYDSAVGGVLTSMEYDNVNGGENMNTTIAYMLRGLVEPDSMGFLGVSMHNGFEHQSNLGYTTNQVIAGIRGLDTIMATNITFPVGTSTIRFYATDKAYADYRNFVLASFNDPRILPKSNIENGMGVFSGMTRVDLNLVVSSEESVPYDHIRPTRCDNEGRLDPNDAWSSKACRLYQDQYCVEDTLRVSSPTCYPSLVKFAMALDTTKWSIFLPDTISDKKKSDAYADGLKRYCVASNFSTNSIADCRELEKQCQVDLKKNTCKEYLWMWCADRNWDLEAHPQCGTALVGRYYIEKQNSPILDRVVKSWCKNHPKDKQCR